MGARERLPLTSAQYGIWLGQQLDPSSPAYWTAEAVELQGDIDAALFEAALRQAVAESDALHQRFASDGEQVWQFPARAEWVLARLRLDDAAARQWMDDDLQHVPDLAQGPLFASALLQTGPRRTLWYLRVHHIALDGFGYALLARRVAALYSALVSGSPAPAPLPAALAPLVAEDAAYLASPACAADGAFWHARLRDAPAPALLAPPAPAGHRVARRRAMLGLDSMERWSAAGADWSAVAIAAFGAWLHRETGARELIIGLPVMNRLGSAALGVPCMAMNIIPLRLHVEPASTLAALARAVALELRSVRKHQRYRYEHLKQALGMAGGRRRLFGAVINIMPFDRPPAFGALAATAHPVSAGPVEDLSLTIAPGPDGVRCDLEANPAAYGDAALDRLHASLIAAMTALTEAPDQPVGQVLPPPALSLLDGGALVRTPEPVLAALARHARATPARIAIEQDGTSLTYGELLGEVATLAGRLRALGVGADSHVALLLPREPRTVVALLAVLWAGGAYIPLDPEGPAARIGAVMADARPQLAITLRRHAALISGSVFCLDDADGAATALTEPEPGASLAYIIYTSGTSGRPNGVMIDRSALAHFVAAAGARYQAGACDRVLQFAPLHFDASVEEIFVSLCSGATLVLRNDAMIASLPRFLDACAERRITVLDLPTAFWHELAYAIAQGQGALPDCVRLVIIGGEAAMPAHVAQWRSHATLLNTYGPTEATVIFTTAILAGQDAPAATPGPMPIGGPLAGLGIAVVDDLLRPVAAGIEGELCLMGDTLARGYLGQPELTAQRFVRLDALPGAPRAYRSGDRVVLGEDGQLRYLGRRDGELKISGVRVDPFEIEAALLSFPGVREAAVVASANGHLMAFLAADTPAPAAGALRAFLSQRLAAAAVPSFYAVRASLPRNRNGKIDRKALCADAVRPLTDTATAGTELERIVMRVWCEVLGIGAPGPHDDFFALGGKSLQAIQVANRIGIALGRDVAVSALFRHPTVTALAQSLGALEGHAPPPGPRGTEFAPLLPIQRGQGPALFCIHPAEGLAWCYLGLARHLPGVPVFGIQARGMTGTAPPDAEAMVDDYLALIRSQQAAGPYRLLGWSSGGGVAHALAVRLRAAGETVSLLAMMDAYPSDIWEGKPEPQERDALLALLDVIGATPHGGGAEVEREAMLARFRRPDSTLAGASDEDLARITGTALHTMRIYRGLCHERFDGALLFFHASERGPDAPDWRLWSRYVGGVIEKIDIASSHNTMSRPAPLAHIGRVLAARLATPPFEGQS